MRNPFAKESVANIVAALTKTVARLESHADTSLAAADDHRKLVTFHAAEASTHETEATQALRVASKVRALVE